MDKLFFSVVIPAWNEQELIADCLSSVFSQTISPKNYEVIIIDNNSTDKTAQVAKKYGARMVKEKTQGIVHARIRGVNEAKGNIIAFTDADSIVPPFWLEKISQAYQNEKVVAVGGPIDFEPKVKTTPLTQGIINSIGRILKVMSGPNMSFKKSAYEKCGGFSHKTNLGEDLLISMNLKKVGRVVIIKDNFVITSSRRFFVNFFSYAIRASINFFSIVYFRRAIFSKLEPVRLKLRTKIPDSLKKTFKKLNLKKRLDSLRLP